MDDKSQELIRGMLYLLEQAYFDVNLYWATITSQVPEIVSDVQERRHDEHRRASVHVLFSAAYAAVENRDATRVEEVLKRIMAGSQLEKPN